MEQSKRVLSKLMISIIIVIAVFMIGCKLYSIAEVSTIFHDYMDLLKKDGDGKYLYLNKSSDWKKDRINESFPYYPEDKWNDGVNSDYPYVKYNSNVWCLAHKQINKTGASLKIQGITEIGTSSNNPTAAKIYAIKKGGGKTTINLDDLDNRKARAESAFTMLVGHATANDKTNWGKTNVTGIAQTHFYDTFASEFEDTELTTFKSNVDTAHTTKTSGEYTYASYGKAVSRLNPNPIDKTQYTDLTSRIDGSSSTREDSNCSPKSTNKKIYASITYDEWDSNENVFNLSSNSSLVTSRKIIVKSDKGEYEYILKKAECRSGHSHWYMYKDDDIVGRITMAGNIYFYTGSNFQAEEKIESVKIRINYKYIHAILYWLGGQDEQTRGISFGEWKTGYFEDEVPVGTTTIIVKSKDVSMQKYITKVNEDVLNSEHTTLTDREDTYSSATESNDNAKKTTHAGATMKKDTYKRGNLVNIDLNDKVTYRVWVYNNDENLAARNIIVRDRLPYYMKNNDKDEATKDRNKYTAVKIISIYQKGNSNDIKSLWKSQIEESENDTNGTKSIVYTINEMAPKSNTYFDITLQFNSQVSGVYTNTASISYKKNETQYRTVDRDYVSMGNYSVSLEKFVSAVNGEPLTQNADRIGKRHNDSLSNGDINKNPYKYNNMVPVDVGDIVTYTIRLKNTGNNPVKITKIYDSFRYVNGYEDADGNIVNTNLQYGLEYVPTYQDDKNKIKANFEGKDKEKYGEITNYNYGSDDIDNSLPTIRRYFIEFNDAQLLEEKDDYIDIYIQFKVTVDHSLTNESKIIYNKAAIRGIKNKNDVEIELKNDSDGTDNNYDCDWVFTQPYSASLEKYVTKVESKNGEEQKQLVKDWGKEREGKRYNEDSTKGNKNTDKLNKKVDVEVGDYVTYTIKLKNTSENTSVRIKQFYDIFHNQDKVKLVYVGENTITGSKGSVYTKSTTDTNNKYLFTSGNAWLLQPGESEYLNLVFKVEVDQSLTTQSQELRNKAGIVRLQNRNNLNVIDCDGENNNHDEDWIKTKTYAVSLEKYVSKVKDNENKEVTYGNRAGKAEYLSYESGRYVDKTNNDSQWTQHNSYKYDNIVKVNNNNEVTYIITVNNDGDTNVKNVIVKDILPNGVKFERIEGEGVKLLDDKDGAKQIEIASITAKGSVTFKIVVMVTERNISNTIYKNTAKIASMQNRNGIDVEDTTGNNNEDSDYIELDYEETPKTTTYKVEKRWVGKSEDADKIVRVGLYKVVGNTEELVKVNGKEQIIELNGKIDDIYEKEEPWTYKWTDLPIYVDESEKQEINYIARELTESGNNIVKGDTKYNDDTTTQYTESGNIMTITNIIKTTPPPGGDPTEYKVEKKWVGKEKEPVTVGLFKVEDNKEILVEKQELSAANNWTYTWTIEEGKYIAREYTKNGKSIVIGDVAYDKETVTKYEDKNGKTIITNSIKTVPTGYTVVKKWIGKSEKVTVGLFKVENNQKTLIEKQKLSAANNWRYTWTIEEEGEYIVREYTKDGKNIVIGDVAYDEETVTKYEDKNGKTIITNTITPPPPGGEPTDYTVIKEWVGKSEKVTVGLFKVENNKETLVKKQELSAANNWTYTWTIEEGEYIVREYTKDGKNIVIGDVIYDENVRTEYIEDKENNTITIKNTYDPDSEKTKFTVEKVWDDENNSANKPSSIEIRLYKVSEDGSETFVKGKKVTLDGEIDKNEKEPWKYTWTELEKGTYVAREYNKGKIENGGKYDDNYSVHYLDKPEKTIITNKNDSDIEEENDDLAIAGIVWNDMALDKTARDYNGRKEAEENVLAGIKVMLYRKDEGIVATTYTNADGEYSFTNESLSTNTSLGVHERYIKGPLVPNTNRWDGTYYSYRVIFEYDGITYTNTKYTAFSAKGSELDSNAQEDSSKRKALNDDFSVIKSDGAYNKNGTSKTCKLKYSTINESEYIPQSIHNYNEKMGIQSSTELITLSNNEDLENKLKHVNLGLRGRDVFDLELRSDVYSTKVTVNGVEGTYKYNSNKVTVRREDAGHYNYLEDTANRHSTRSTYEGEAYSQSIRNTDSDFEVESDKRKTNYTETGLGIEVTYKITVQNTSITEGAATKIINYYDDKYTFVKAYSGSMEMTIDNGNAEYKESGTGYKSVEIKTPGTRLSQTKKMEIYVVYTLNNAESILKNIDMLATFNMAEITEYKTFTTEYQNNTNNEATRGLIDLDSAPGSASSEDVRLDPNLIGDKSTVEYYFGGNDLSILKYEDDTYATPTLYFVSDESIRILEGIVFEDFTTVDQTTRIKTGNGVKNGDEPGVFGATVQLIELNDDGTEKAIRYQGTTDKDGYFKFEGYLPGKYIIRYHYGDTSNTALLHQSTEKADTNKQSYNGEDYQATNNTGSYGAKTLPGSGKHNWYAYNEEAGVSTATDNSARRLDVSTNVTNFTDEEMTVLNNMRDLVGTYDKSADDGTLTSIQKYNINKTELIGFTTVVKGIEKIIDETKMDAATPQMLLTVEETKLYGDTASVEERFASEYTVSGMNFGIAEVPVTTIDLQKHIIEFNIMDSTGQNKIAGITRKTRQDGSMYWEPEGNVIAPEVASNIAGIESTIDVSIEDEKLQGARLQVTYEITADMATEVNYDDSTNIVPTLTGVVDFIDNDLSYNQALGDNAKFWELTTTEDLGNVLSLMKYKEDGTVPTGTVDSSKHTIILKAKQPGVDADGNTVGNPLLLTQVGKGSATITLEKVLSSTESTLEDIIGSMVDIYEYSNVVEIVGFNYGNSSKDLDGDGQIDIIRDRIRNKGRYIILPGVQHDNASAEIITIHPPTGNNMSITYYVMAVIGLAILAVGVFGIKKYVIKK